MSDRTAGVTAVRLTAIFAVTRLLAVLAAALLLAGCNPFATQPARDWPEPAPALWEIGPAEAPTGWLFGTVHALPAGLEWHTAVLTTALRRADPLVVEIANLADAIAAQDAFEAASRQPGLPPLLERVPAADRPRLAALIAQAGIAEADLSRRKSWAAALMLASATRRDDPVLGVDRALLEGARRVVGLETFAIQFARFDSLSARAQGQLLLAVADDALTPDTARQTLTQAWLTGDLPRFETLADGRLLADPELRDTLLSRRNQAFAARIAELIESGAHPFVAVGAGHMAGAQGLPALLTARGLTVRRIQ